MNKGYLKFSGSLFLIRLVEDDVVFIILKQELRDEIVEISTWLPVVFQQHAALRRIDAGVHKRAG